MTKMKTTWTAVPKQQISSNPEPHYSEDTSLTLTLVMEKYPQFLFTLQEAYHSG